MKAMKDYKVVSLFSGCGGLDLGIEGNFDYLGNHYAKNPFKVIWANDINEKATQTQKLNFRDINVISDAYRQVGNAVALVFAWHLSSEKQNLISRRSFCLQKLRRYFIILTYEFF